MLDLHVVVIIFVKLSSHGYRDIKFVSLIFVSFTTESFVVFLGKYRALNEAKLKSSSLFIDSDLISSSIPYSSRITSYSLLPKIFTFSDDHNFLNPRFFSSSLSFDM
ncbi:GfV-B53-ORF1 [Ichnoviriform fumiferanae]|uniref:GfV-B53-ORF1 n=1 Tax=Ichnoviriform fumiferanae TaxID=419435 RepID=A2PZU9_9VIRU|nr:GfV-B53-ORF1 [Ichnoviriform fumiferanae]BAF45521.1 GfV-B53-ORF1 [Ichnoviriform fumiferanae]